MKKIPKIVKWISYKKLMEYEEKYKDKFFIPEANYDESHKEVLMKEIIDNKYIICGDTHQNLFIPVFDDGYLLLSMRKWSEVMYESISMIDSIRSAIDNLDKNTFYIASVCPLKESLPNVNK